MHLGSSQLPSTLALTPCWVSSLLTTTAYYIFVIATIVVAAAKAWLNDKVWLNDGCQTWAFNNEDDDAYAREPTIVTWLTMQRVGSILFGELCAESRMPER